MIKTTQINIKMFNLAHVLPGIIKEVIVDIVGYHQGLIRMF